MNIFLNGEALTTEFNTLYELVQSLQLDGKRFAVEMNERIVPKSRLAETIIQNNDKIEIIQAVGGG